MSPTSAPPVRGALTLTGPTAPPNSVPSPGRPMREPMFTGKARPHYFLPGTVFDAALNRMRWIFDEFDNHVSVSTSGGKDSTVVLELAAMVNRERGLPPLKAHFLDQEAEYGATISYMRYLHRERADIDLDWYQIPFRLFNATTHAHQWSFVWDASLPADGSEYIRPKEPDTIHDNPFRDRRGNTIDRFKECLKAMNRADGGAILTGMRCEESPTRRVFMTSVPSYKWATWCSGGKGEPFHLFHPIYDWTYRDVWKSILDNGWRYNSFYDAMYQQGVRLQAMRVSSFHHEQSMQALSYLQEVEPDTWERATRRWHGINTYAHTGSEIYNHYQYNLPYMFGDWIEYLNYLIDKLVVTEADRETFRKMQRNAEHVLPHIPRREIAKFTVTLVMFNDVYGSNMSAWIAAQKAPAKHRDWERWKREQLAAGTWSPAEEEGRAA